LQEVRVDNSTYKQNSDTQHPRGSFTAQQIGDRLVKWLASLFHLTDEEQKDAGIYLGKKHNE
jgi:hypothetical protein